MVDGGVSAIAAHYDSFPYPHIRADLGSFQVSVRSLDPGSRIWIAGCGTMQAARWGRAFPEAQIIATDVSARSIEVAADLVRRHGITNVVFDVADLVTSAPRDGFDLVVCTGVVHHLPDPRSGLRAIARSLEPTGEALIMVYRRSVRAPLVDLRRAVLAASGADASPTARMHAARAELADRNDRLGLLLKRLARATPTVVADAIANPIEHHFEPDEIPDLLAGTGLTFDRWRHCGSDPGDHHLEFFCRPTPAITATRR